MSQDLDFPSQDSIKFPEEDNIKFETNDGVALTEDDIVELAVGLVEEVDPAVAAGLVGSEVEQDDQERVEQIEAILDAQAAPAKVYCPTLISELRRLDNKKKNRTCAKCARRRPLAEMQGGTAELCEDCRG